SSRSTRGSIATGPPPSPDPFTQSLNNPRFSDTSSQIRWDSNIFIPNAPSQEYQHIDSSQYPSPDPQTFRFLEIERGEGSSSAGNRDIFLDDIIHKDYLDSPGMNLHQLRSPPHHMCFT